MKILVLSDSHGREEYVYSILNNNRDADIVIHLGDGENDMDLSLREIPGITRKRFFAVKGNCDLMSSLPTTTYENICGYKFYITHGFKQQVKSGVSEIFLDAKNNERQVVLFGHTHRPFYEERDGIYLFNPGAVMRGSYGIITIDDLPKDKSSESGEKSIYFEHHEL